jgi:hypothetical protein
MSETTHDVLSPGDQAIVDHSLAKGLVLQTVNGPQAVRDALTGGDGQILAGTREVRDRLPGYSELSKKDE